jgi:hypothetical protein
MRKTGDKNSKDNMHNKSRSLVGNSNSNKVAVPNFASDPVPTPDFGPFASGYHPLIG